MIAISGASGQLGKLVIEALLQHLDAENIVALARQPEKLEALRAQGVEVRHADYNKPQTLAPALAGIDQLLLISGSEVGQRVAQHSAVIEAARAAEVSHLVYTSILKADSSPLILAQEHRETEAMIKTSGLIYTLLRNGWYSENYTSTLAGALDAGVLCSAAGQGKLHSAARADYAAAAAEVLRNSAQHRNKTYELAGSSGFTLQAYAALAADLSNSALDYREMNREEFSALLVQFGLPESFAAVLADAEIGIANGWLEEAGGELAALIGRATTPIESSIAAALEQRATSY
ncbi:MAG: NAD(P)H-binding protein [Pseudomonadales bacterium]